jgi:hypothetical protein
MNQYKIKIKHSWENIVDISYTKFCLKPWNSSGNNTYTWKKVCWQDTACLSLGNLLYTYALHTKECISFMKINNFCCISLSTSLSENIHFKITHLKETIYVCDLRSISFINWNSLPRWIRVCWAVKTCISAKVWIYTSSAFLSELQAFEILVFFLVNPVN